MTIAILIVGINQWKEFTHDLICDLKDWAVGAEIIVIDNASDEPYPQGEGYKVIRTDERLCYSAAINTAARATDADWLLSMNNDISCYGDLISIIEGLEPNAVYSRQIITEHGQTWFGNWVVAIPRQVWAKVGEFDEGFNVCGFEDADYSMRALKAGFPTLHVDLPLIHHWGKTRWDIPGYAGTREQNIAYFASKWGWTPGQNMVVIHD